MEQDDQPFVHQQLRRLNAETAALDTKIDAAAAEMKAAKSEAVRSTTTLWQTSRPSVRGWQRWRHN